MASTDGQPTAIHNTSTRIVSRRFFWRLEMVNLVGLRLGTTWQLERENHLELPAIHLANCKFSVLPHPTLYASNQVARNSCHTPSIATDY